MLTVEKLGPLSSFFVSFCLSVSLRLALSHCLWLVPYMISVSLPLSVALCRSLSLSVSLCPSLSLSISAYWNMRETLDTPQLKSIIIHEISKTGVCVCLSLSLSVCVYLYVCVFIYLSMCHSLFLYFTLSVSGCLPFPLCLSEC